jgi:hypothetical protein
MEFFEEFGGTMKEANIPLLDSFINWANDRRSKLRPDVEVDVELGPAYEKRGAWMNLNDDSTIGHIMVWDSGEYETLYRIIGSDSDPEYFYGIETGYSDFDGLFSKFLEHFIDIK